MSEVEPEAAELPEGADPNTGEDVTEEPSTSQEDAPAEPPKEPRGVQKRINELTANWRDEQRRAQQLLEQNLELQRRLVKPEEAQAPSNTEPKPDDFDSYEDFVDARADYRAEQKFRELREQEVQAEQAARQQAAHQTFQERAQTFRETHEDFDEVAMNPSLNVTDDMAGLLNATEKGPELLYHLGKNPQEADRIARLPTAQAAMELGRIEASLGAVRPNTVTGAPPPIEPLTDGQGSRSKDPDEMSTSEWMEWRRSQLESK